MSDAHSTTLTEDLGGAKHILGKCSMKLRGVSAWKQMTGRLAIQFVKQNRIMFPKEIVQTKVLPADPSFKGGDGQLDSAVLIIDDIEIQFPPRRVGVLFDNALFIQKRIMVNWIAILFDMRKGGS